MKSIEDQARAFSKFDPATDVGTDLGSYRQGLFEGFLAGYQAAKDEISRRIPSDQELHLQAMTSLSVGTSSHTNIQFAPSLGWVKKI